MEWSKSKAPPVGIRTIDIWVEQFFSKNAPSFFSNNFKFWFCNFSFSAHSVILDLKVQLAFDYWCGAVCA